MSSRSSRQPVQALVTARAALTAAEMRAFLSKSVSSFNQNKINGILAEVEFRRHLVDLGFGDRVSAGGWIARCEARGQFTFGQNAAVFFPETVRPGQEYDSVRVPPTPHHGLHTICATFHQIGIHSFFCAATVEGIDHEGLPRVSWRSVQLGLPTQQQYRPFPAEVSGFNPRQRRHGFLKYSADATGIADHVIAEEFSKEALRIAFAERFYAEVSDIDGLFWGQQNTYPIEIKEKTVADDRSMRGYFGLDVGPFVKLAYYAAKRGNMHSMFVVREIDDVQSRSLVAWRFITFERLAQFASWNFVAGGRNMRGGASATIRIPKDQFSTLDATALAGL